MKITMNRIELLAALRKAKGITAGAGIMMLKAVRIASYSRPDGAGIEVSATNLEESIRLEVAGEDDAGAGFSGLVGPERLIAFLGADPGKEVTVWEEKGKLVVKGLARGTFPIEDATLFPTMPVLEIVGGQGLVIEEEVAKAIRRAGRFAEHEGKLITENMRQVYLWEEGGLLTVGGTEGHALWVEKGLAVAEPGFAMALPIAAASGIEACRLTSQGGHIFLSKPGEVLSVRRPEVDEGMLKRALPSMRRQADGVAIDGARVLAAVKATAARIGKDVGEHLVLRIREEKGGSVIYAQGLNGEAVAELPDVLPAFVTQYVELLVTGLESLVEVQEEGEELRVQAGTGNGLYFDIAEKVELVLTGLKEK